MNFLNFLNFFFFFFFFFLNKPFSINDIGLNS